MVFSLAPVLFFSLHVLADTLPNSFPHVYAGQPSGDYSVEWQDYFQVTEKLPNVTFDIGRSFAGNIGVQRSGHDNDTLFFWAIEKSNGSLTASANSSTDPWGIWLNGGPGTSSMYGLLFENGPIHLRSDYSAYANNYSWNTVADYIWIDQPVGVGYSTADADGYIADEDQMGTDFMGFLENLVKVFPSLRTRPLHLTGESYSGVYIPYILKAYFAMTSPPVNISKIVIGDGTVASGQVFELLPAVSVIETHPEIIGYDPDVYNYFKEQSHLCGYDVNLTYPQEETIPSVNLSLPTGRDVIFFEQQRASGLSVMKELSRRYADEKRSFFVRERQNNIERDLSLRTNGTIDPWYGCLLFDMFVDYAINYTYPWNFTTGFDVYDIPDALNPEVTADPSVFMNDASVVQAIHAPTSKEWAMTFEYTFGNLEEDPSPEPMVFLSELASNATDNDIGVVLYSGNDDALIAHRGTEVTIQNTTFGGIRGFTRKPSTPWYDDSGNMAGIVHQERNWTYILFQGTGHLVPLSSPANALTFIREFVFGTNTTGLVITDSTGQTSVVGGENVSLEDIIPASDEIYYGSASTQFTYVYPSATQAAWRSFIATATQTATSSGSANLSSANSAVILKPSSLAVMSIVLTFISLLDIR